MRIFNTLFLLFFFNINAQQYYVGEDINYHLPSRVSRSSTTKSASSPLGYSYIYQSNYLRKILPNGENDLSFGVNGVSTSVIPLVHSNVNAGAIAVNDQNIFLASNGIIAKYDVNGNLDTSFGNNGYFDMGQTIYSIEINHDLGLFVKKDNSLYKIKPTGQLDSSFSLITGVKSFFITNTAIIVKISDYQFKKYNLSGAQDLNFGIQGILRVSESSSSWGVIGIGVNKYTGDIFVSERYPVELKKYNENGVRDTSFGTNGVATFQLPAGDNWYPDYLLGPQFIRVLKVDSTGRILLFGGTGENQNSLDKVTAVIIRFNTDGTLDNSFNNGNSFYYKRIKAAITDVNILNDNSYICSDYFAGFGLSYGSVGITKYLRTNDVANLSVKEIASTKLSVYPNPIEDILTIELNANEKLQKLNIYAIDGRLVFTGTELKSNLKFLSSGDYIAEIKTNNNTYRKKIIKK
ncbi:delta-60 repeat domain-containing protein/Por secretion system C-terminal sorting domain-containing protein [Chryseobacterium ureilyticum]|uniref:Delta-60 repeat domain-containing protein/Por secretion system C-terminal sorting domain-containing protein n=1 Tax=Chryseobacterium ureilyticum TaxID=373668 RepID=A0A1N7QNA2_9FLAO|nr:T9SS type A sorting domain-containing protein [Chryseobacterium ureilyticum]SIT24259.1 delta-60 repeat domain-containing protein/Por secretion system C-terminal sorting domain-containing protein [Chryseobacterium ureilyticum]